MQQIYLKGLTELSKMVPEGKENRDDKVGLSYVMADAIRQLGGIQAKERLISEGGMTKDEFKELEKQLKAGMPTKQEAANNVGDKFLEKSGILKPRDEEYEAAASYDGIRILD